MKLTKEVGKKIEKVNKSMPGFPQEENLFKYAKTEEGEITKKAEKEISESIEL